MFSKSLKLVRISLIAGVFLLISGCGGGGGGGGSSEAVISYAGNTDPALMSRSNAARLASNVLSGQGLVALTGSSAKSDKSSSRAATGFDLVQFPARLTHRLRNSIPLPTGFSARPTRLQARTEIDSVDPCLNPDGLVHVTGFLEDNSTGTLSFDYSNCRDGDETLDGKMTIQVIAFDLGLFTPSNAILSFSVLTLKSPLFSVSMSGSIHLELFPDTGTEQLSVERLVARDNGSGEIAMITNLLSNIEYDNINFPSTLSSVFSGRIFDSTHGYVDFNTVSPVFFSDLSKEFPDSGQLLISGRLNSAIRLTVRSDTHALLDLDLDGNSVYETSTTLSWIELESETDLTDSDSDGMHDSYEIDHGLNPLDAADAEIDSDGDGFTNFTEYQAGSDPDNILSTLPPIPPVIISQQTSDIIYDPAGGKIYASIPSGAASGADSIAIIDPVSGQLETTIPIGSDPGPLAISADGQFLYVGLNGSAKVRQFDIASQTAGLEFSLGSDPLSGPYFAEDIEVLPGDASAIAVSRKYSGISPRHAGVGVYDSGVPRANVTDGHTGSNVIAFGQSANTLYGYNTETTESGLRTMSVDATGVTVLDVTQNLIQSSSADIEFSDGYLYSSNGRVIDAATRILDGTFAINSFGALVEPDAAAGRVFFLEAVDFNTSWQLKAFNSGTLGLINSEPVSNVKGFPSSLIRWGSHGLAFRTSEKQIFLVTTALVQKF